MARARAIVERTHALTVVLDPALPPEDGELAIRYYPHRAEKDLTVRALAHLREAERVQEQLDALGNDAARDAAELAAIADLERKGAAVLLPCLASWEMWEDEPGGALVPLDVEGLVRFGGGVLGKIANAIREDLAGPDPTTPATRNGARSSPPSSRSAPAAPAGESLAGAP